MLVQNCRQSQQQESLDMMEDECIQEVEAHSHNIPISSDTTFNHKVTRTLLFVDVQTFNLRSLIQYDGSSVVGSN